MKDNKLIFNLGDNVVQFKISDLDDNLDLDKILKIDYSNLVAEMLTFPVIVNKFGLLAADMDNLVSEAKLDLSIYEAKKKEQLREDLTSDNGKKPTIAEVDDNLYLDVKWKIKKKKYYKVIKEKEYIYSIYFAAKDKSKKLDKLSLTIRPGDLDEKIIQKQLNNVYFKIKKGTITDD